MAPSLDQAALDQLQNADAKALLDTVDGLRAIGVDKHVSLPQIVVCGDQSSGKSSVLEAISRVPFPTNSSACTKFAIELVMRQSPTRSSRVLIRAGPSRSEAEKATLQAFNTPFTSPAEFPSLVESAGDRMQNASANGNPNGFFDDVLSVEVTGPEQPHLTIIDLPGFIHAANQNQTDEDIQKVKRLVTSYMKSSRSIILAVVSANNNYANQVVLTYAKNLDPTGSRTMGIVTKPDLVEPGSSLEEDLRALVTNGNDYYHFAYGWHILRNRTSSTTDVSSEDRDRLEEEYFLQSVWPTIKTQDSLGVGTLRTRLSGISLEKIRSDLPMVSETIRSKLAECKQELKTLGDARSTPEHYRRHLIHVSNQINRLASDATKGMYSTNLNFFVDDGSATAFKRKLRSAVRRHNLLFAQVMRQYGHTWDISDRTFPIFGTDKAVEKVKQDLRLSRPEHVSINDYQRKIEAMDERHHGLELEGIPNPMLINNLFHKQSDKWKPIATYHLDVVHSLAMEFVGQVLHHVADESTAHGMMEEYVQPFMVGRREALDAKLDELLLPFRSAHAMSYNPLFTGGITNLVYAEAHTNQASNTQGSQTPQQQPSHRYDTILRLFRIYYEVALNVFVDNVACLAVENCLMKPLGDMIRIEDILETWDDRKLEKVFSEPAQIRKKRQYFTGREQVLQAGLDVCTRQNLGFSTQSTVNEAEKMENDLSSIFSQMDMTKPAYSFPPGVSVRSSTPQEGASSQTASSASTSSPPFGTQTSVTSSFPNSPARKSSPLMPQTASPGGSPRSVAWIFDQSGSHNGMRRPYIEREDSMLAQYETDPVYMGQLSKSFEELRLEDYNAGREPNSKLGSAQRWNQLGTFTVSDQPQSTGGAGGAGDELGGGSSWRLPPSPSPSASRLFNQSTGGSSSEL